MQATATATDPLGGTADDTQTIATGGASTVRTLRTSFFATRVNWGNSIDETNQGPDLGLSDFYQAPVGPVTLGTTLTTVRDCRIPGMRVFKHPLAAGAVVFAMWNSSGTLLRSKTATWTSDDGGWQTITWDAPVSAPTGAEYNFGYYYPGTDSHYAASLYVWNNSQDTCVYPFLMRNYSASGAGVRSGGMWFKVGAALTFSAESADRVPANYYIDPIAEWEVDYPGYDSGTGYFDQFPNGGSRFDFPIAVYWPDPPFLAGYKALGVNTMLAGSVDDAYTVAVKAAQMDWYPTLHGNDMSAPVAVQEDPDLAACIRGYMLTDEPEFNRPFNSPDTLRTWRNNCRKIDSTRPIYLNMSRIAQENQGFTWQPAGISALDVNQQWRDYMALADMGSLDCYGIANTYPFTYSSSDSRRYGIWIYPLVIDRMRREITDEKMPIWGVVETTSAYAAAPTPDQVKRASWASLIAGATGLEYFDHRFTSAQVSKDFAAMLQDPVMSAAVLALNAQIQSLAPALLAPDAGLVESYTSDGELTHAQGGYPAGAKIPMLYTSRLAGGTTYLFAQSIRDGQTTATFFAPSLADAVLTVIDESRTVTIDGDGFFTDDFDDGNYTYHLYSTSTDPAYTAPTNTLAPALSTDGTPQTGEAISCSAGTWSGTPTPVDFSYQWQRDGSDISGETAAAHTLQVEDEGADVTCDVTATNVAGSATATSNTVIPAAPAPPSTAHFDEVMSHAVVAFWQLKALTDEVGGFTLTNTGSVADGASMINDADSGSKSFTSDTAQTLSVADDAALRLVTGGWSAELWMSSAATSGSALTALQKHDHYRIRIGSDSKVHAFVYTTGGNFWEITGTTTISQNLAYHVVLTWDGSTATLYVNGAANGTVSTTNGPNSTTSPVCIGKDLGSGTNGWFGRLQVVSLYSETLSADDALALYESSLA